MRHKVSLVGFEKNQQANLFWEKMGFSARNDRLYQNQERAEMIRQDT